MVERAKKPDVYEVKGFKFEDVDRNGKIDGSDRVVAASGGKKMTVDEFEQLTGAKIRHFDTWQNMRSESSKASRFLPEAQDVATIMLPVDGESDLAGRTTVEGATHEMKLFVGDHGFQVKLEGFEVNRFDANALRYLKAHGYRENRMRTGVRDAGVVFMYRRADLVAQLREQGASPDEIRAIR